MTIQITEVKEFTVVVLRPDYERDGSPNEWTFVSYVLADSVLEAQDAAYLDAARVSGNPVEDYAVLAVFEGRYTDISM